MATDFDLTFLYVVSRMLEATLILRTSVGEGGLT